MRRGIGIAAALAALVLLVPQSASAQSDINNPEDVRDALQRLMTTYEQMAPGSQPMMRHGQRVRDSLDNLDAQQLDILYQTYTASPRLMETVTRLNQSAAAPAGLVDIARTDSSTYGALADPIYSEICGDQRVDTQTANDQLTAWQEMALAAAEAQGNCDAATSGDTQQDNVTVCPVAAMANEAALTARFAYEMTLFCQRDIDSAEISATLASTGELQTALGDLQTGLGDLGSDLDSRLQMIDDALSAHDAAISQALATHDAEVKQAIASVASDLEGMVQQILDNQQTMIANQEAIMMLLLTPQGRRPGWNGRPEGNNGNGNGGN